MSIEALQKRAKAVRARATVRAWEYRQRKLSKGVWLQLRAALAHSAEAYAVAAEEAQRLVAEGFFVEPVGAELEPSKTIIFVPAERAGAIAGRRSLALRMSAELLGERNLVLVRFEQ